MPAASSSSDLGPGALCPRRQQRRHGQPQPAAAGRSLPRAALGIRSWHPVWCPTGICRRTQRRKQEGQKGPVKGRNCSGFPDQEPCSLRRRRGGRRGVHGPGRKSASSLRRLWSGGSRREARLLSLAQPRGQRTADSRLRSSEPTVSSW